MGLIGKLVIIIVLLGFLLGASAYIIVYTGDNDNNTNGGNDTEPPQIIEVSGNLTVTAGQTATITARFTDNVNVTVATLFYQTAGSTDWNSISILSGSANISIPSSATSNYYYYITVDDAAGNGPVGNPSTNGTTFYIITVKPSNGGDNGNENLPHIVFVEDGTVSWCNICPLTAEILDTLYKPDKPDFYYVSMVSDLNNKAEQRLNKSYNVNGYPTVIFDGGYEVAFGKQAETVYKDMLSSAAAREVPKLYLKVDSKWNQSNNRLTANVIIKNKNAETYKGYLRVYITEINSRWADLEGNPYHFGFLDYAIDKPIEIGSNSEATFSGEWLANTSGYTNIYPENLFLIAVIFNSNSTQKFSDPPTNKNSFDAYYADAVNATRVVNGSLPPSVGICWPKKARYCLLGFCNENLYAIHGRTVVIGRTKITVCIEADLQIEKVEFTIQGPFRKIQNTDDQAPFQLVWHKLAFGIYTISVEVYDTKGRIATDSMEVFAVIL